MDLDPCTHTNACMNVVLLVDKLVDQQLVDQQLVHQQVHIPGHFNMLLPGQTAWSGHDNSAPLAPHFLKHALYSQPH